MSTLDQLREELGGAWDNLVDGWQRLYRRAAGAMTRFTPGKKSGEDSKGRGQEISTRGAGWGVLASEVFDDENKIVVRLEVPGMEKEDFDLQVMDGYLVIRGEKQIERERSEGRYHVTECAYGQFERAIPLPVEIETGEVQASYKKGILRVELPKSAGGRRNKVRVEIR